MLCAIAPPKKGTAGLPILYLPEKSIVWAEGGEGGTENADSSPAQGKGDSAFFTQIAMQSLWNIKVAVLVKPEHENRISHVSTSSVKTGIANTLGEQSRQGPFPCLLLLLQPKVSSFWVVSVFPYIELFELCKACSYSESLPVPSGRQTRVITSIL